MWIDKYAGEGAGSVISNCSVQHFAGDVVIASGPSGSMMTVVAENARLTRFLLSRAVSARHR